MTDAKKKKKKNKKIKKQKKKKKKKKYRFLKRGVPRIKIQKKWITRIKNKTHRTGYLEKILANLDPIISVRGKRGRG